MSLPPFKAWRPKARLPGWINGWGWRMVLWQAAILLAVFTLFRLAFLAMYLPAFLKSGGGAALGALARGWRFDLSVVAAAGFLPWLALFAGSPWRGRRWLLAAALAPLLAVALVFFVLMGMDLFYYGFVGRRLSYEVIAMLGEWRQITAMALGGYLWQTVLILLLLAGAALFSTRFLWKKAAAPYRPVGWLAQGGQTLALALLLLLAARGGLQGKPLSVGMAFVSSDVALGHLALNPIFTALMSLDHSRQQLFSFQSPEQALALTRQRLELPAAPDNPRFPLLRHIPASTGPTRQTQPPHLVIIVLESFSARYVGALGGRKGVTPNLDKLARQGLLFTRFHANGTRSLEGIASLITGYPALPNVTLIGSSQDQTTMRGLPWMLKDQGYQPLFLHGAFLGSMGFDAFAAKMGFQRYLSRDDMADWQSHYDGAWGVYDGQTLERLHQELSQATRPTLAFYFSLTSHPPYHLPPEASHPFGPETPDGEILNALHYTDQALGHFFQLAAKSPYYQNSLFAITADHPLRADGRDLKQGMTIPLLLLRPGQPGFPTGRRDTLGSQMDLAPTLLSLLGVGHPAAYLGRPLVGPHGQPGQGPRQVLFAWGAQAGWLDEEGYLVHDLEKPVALYQPAQDPGLAHSLITQGKPLPARLEGPLRRFEAFLQTANNLLLENRVYPP